MQRGAEKGEIKRAGMSAKRSQLHADQEAWEDSLMLHSGVASVQEAQTVFDEEEGMYCCKHYTHTHMHAYVDTNCALTPPPLAF